MQVIASRNSLLDATIKGNFNLEKVREIAALQGKNLAALIVERGRVKSQIYPILTTGQREKVESIRKRFEDRLLKRSIG